MCFLFLCVSPLDFQVSICILESLNSMCVSEKGGRNVRPCLTDCSDISRKIRHLLLHVFCSFSHSTSITLFRKFVSNVLCTFRLQYFIQRVTLLLLLANLCSITLFCLSSSPKASSTWYPYSKTKISYWRRIDRDDVNFESYQRLKFFVPKKIFQREK